MYVNALHGAMQNFRHLSMSGPDGTKIGVELCVLHDAVMNGRTKVTGWMPTQEAGYCLFPKQCLPLRGSYLSCIDLSLSSRIARCQGT